jgi:2-hydroxy-6-oxonona-2,4-dienedioate hydrolase
MANEEVHLTSPADSVARIARSSRRIETPCGNGAMVWRVWGSGSPLLLLHGGYGSWTHWLRNIESLAADHMVIAPDSPGLGDSATPPEPHSAEAMAAIIGRGLNVVVPAGQQVAVAGFSFGAVLGGHLAAQQGKRIRCLLMIGPSALGEPRPGRTDLKPVRAGMSAAEILALQRANLAKLMFFDAAKIDDLAVYLQDENTRRARVRSRDIAWSDSLARILPSVSARLGAIWGDHDTTAVPFLQEKLDQLETLRPGLYLEVFLETGHWAQWEAAIMMNDRLRRFITQI